MSEAPLVVSDLLNLVDGSLCGAGQAVAFGLSASVVCVIWAAGGLGQDCDVRPVAMPSGYSWAPTPSQRTSVNVGSDPVPPCLVWLRQGDGQVRRPLWASGRGGAAVVLRAQESCAHGEGRQRDRRSLGAEEPLNSGATTSRPGKGGVSGTRSPAQASPWAAAEPDKRFGTCSTSSATRRRCSWRWSGSRATGELEQQASMGSPSPRRTGDGGAGRSWTRCAPCCDGSFTALPVRQVAIPKKSGNLR